MSMDMEIRGRFGLIEGAYKGSAQFASAGPLWPFAAAARALPCAISRLGLE